MPQLSEAALLAYAAELAAPWMTFPNPRVGCVITDANGAIIGEGAHHALGQPHAEVNALAVAASGARGGTAFVTLEPCAHTGLTGPCTQALMEAGVSRVVIGAKDPNPMAAGGADVLRTAGIEVVFASSPESEAVNEHWLHAIRVGRPFVTLKMATTLDGRVASGEGFETAISNQASKRRVHALRARVDAILVGTQTAIIDDPQLNVREVSALGQPQRFVMGLRELPAGLHLSAEPGAAVRLRTRDPRAALAQLQERRIRHVLIEGGPTIARTFLMAGLVDECIWITAPKVFGSGPAAVEGALETVSDWRRIETFDLDQDLWSILRPASS